MERGPAGWAFIIVIFILAAPSLTFAQVVINEVMYNPQGSDTGREWIELYNEGESDVTMVGGSGKGSWRINDGSNHTLIDPASGTGRGSLTVPAGGYLIIASDPTEFSSGEYTGGTYSVVKSSIALNNNGATITLLDGTGSTVDTFSYTPSQGGNDDGSSLQKQTDGSWIAALPTPGNSNSATPYVAPPATDTSTDTSQSDVASSSATTQTQTLTQNAYVAPPAPSLYADAGGDRTVIVGADVEFDASAYDREQTLLDPSTVRFMWNFGDGSTAEGDSVLHHFSYPGRYDVVLEIAENRNAASDQIVITAQPAALSFSLLPDGGVQIEDLAGHDLDLSDWVVREDAGAFAQQFVLPPGSKTLSDSSMQIAPATLQFRASSSSALDYPNGTLALAMGGDPAPDAPTQDPPTRTVPPSTPVVAVLSSQDQPPPASVVPIDTDDSAQPDPSDADAATDTDNASASFSTSTVLQTAAVSATFSSTYIWWLGLLAFIAAVAAAAIAAAYFKKGEWDIIEDKSE